MASKVSHTSNTSFIQSDEEPLIPRTPEPRQRHITSEDPLDEETPEVTSEAAVEPEECEQVPTKQDKSSGSSIPSVIG